MKDILFPIMSNIYAYDSYVLECAERLKSDLATLDRRMKNVAGELKISIIEV
jgi:predicted nucleic acid-binding protein